jgi:hypothetical protein
MQRSDPESVNDPSPELLAEEAETVRMARIRRDLALTPAERLDKLASLCREADLLRDARRLS